MNDLSPMPFGKYKGTPMQDVPANYLLWLWDNGLKEKFLSDSERSEVHQYIKDSMSALKQECPDWIES